MLAVQVISNKRFAKTDKLGMKYSSFDSPMTFDLYDINIIDLQSESLWKNEKSEVKAINYSNDLKSLCALIKTNRQSKIIVLLPPNYQMIYHKNVFAQNTYDYGYYLKDKIEWLKDILKVLVPEIETCDMIYENAVTKCGENFYNSAFGFLDCESVAITVAEGSGRATTISISEDCILSTLLIDAQKDALADFIEGLGLADEKPVYPPWLLELNRFDDKEQKHAIVESKSKIDSLKKEINAAEEAINKNLRYKSILTENGDKLVSVVFDILQDIFDYDLTEFKDVKKEDFLIKLKDVTFIGEIKGITSNVKSENVSQVDVHYQAYTEELAEKGKTENVKAVLIINSQRNKPLDKREPVHENQVKLAQRNGSLIITTDRLLELYEKFVMKKIATENIIDMFGKQTGLFVSE